ncbi:MAG: glycine oxidase ThiO [Candidatus Poribacteria bacterium]|nr:glycine oxidase ThiO [Candidatus Poribacteria bacterium]
MQSHSSHSNQRIIIIGGGVIGLGIGWQLAKAGCTVSIYERDQAGRAASWAAAGMLSPLAEVNLNEGDLRQIGLTSSQMYPKWVQELESDSGMSVELRTEGTLIIALDRDDMEELQHLYELQQMLNLPVEWLTGAEAREVESSLSPRVTAAISCDADFQVDNRLMAQALTHAFQKLGGMLHEENPVEKIEIQDEAAAGVWVNGTQVEADVVVLSAGCWSPLIPGLPEAIRPPVRPVKGQMLALQMDQPPIIQKVIHAPDTYLVPKNDGRLLVGATSEEQGFDTQLTAGGMFELLRGAWEALPGIYDFPIVETWVGLRPGSRDNAPILGKTAIENLIMATGHYRKGILLAPVTAREIASLILTGETSEIIEPFQLSRFS